MSKEAVVHAARLWSLQIARIETYKAGKTSPVILNMMLQKERILYDNFIALLEGVCQLASLQVAESQSVQKGKSRAASTRMLIK